jgi:pimeloyl-ACP methyl ester carboxylesterase
MLFHRDSGSGVPLLLLHGFTGSGDNWNHVFAETLPGYRVITPDLPGTWPIGESKIGFQVCRRRARRVRAP